ncbi:MAG: site-2 protease family protein [Anaerolineales bacterium]
MEGVRDLAIFVLVLGGLIFFHELGHFLAAIKVGIRVKEFGIGFPPRLVKLGNWRGTDFTLNWIPFGGYVRPIGEDDPLVAGGLAAAPKRHRVFMLAAGPAMNVAVAFVVLAIGFSTGWPDQVVITAVEPSTPAAGAGLQPGDIVLRADEVAIHTPAALIDITHASLGRPVYLLLERDGERIAATVEPRTEWPEGQGPMGIGLSWDVVAYPIHRAAGRAGEEIVAQVRDIALLPVRLITQQVLLSQIIL